jgi:hypothetical protein
LGVLPDIIAAGLTFGMSKTRLTKTIMKSAISKKQIRSTIEVAMTQALSSLAVSTPSKKTKKAIHRISRKLSSELKPLLKKDLKVSAKRAKGLNGKLSEPAQSKSQLIQAS